MAEYEWKIGLIEMVFMKQYSRMPPKITHSQSNNVSRNFYSLLLLFCLPYFIFIPNFSFFFFCSLWLLAQSSINSSFFRLRYFVFLVILRSSSSSVWNLRMHTKVWINLTFEKFDDIIFSSAVDFEIWYFWGKRKFKLKLMTIKQW